MAQSAELRCRCGEVQGQVSDATPNTVSRIVCYCDDCQAFAHQLGRADLLDSHGGSDIVQVAPASLTFTRGADRIVGLRLSPKGLYRWYASCCNTPVGNTLEPKLPFVGISAQSFARPDESFGKPRGAVQGKFAIGTPPAGSVKPNIGLLLGAIGKVLGWRLRGKAYPHPYFDRATRTPSRPVRVISKAERAALRPLCGPKPSAT